MKKAILIPILLSLAACGTLPPEFCRTDEVLLPAVKEIKIDPKLIEPCNPLPTVELQNFNDVLLTTKDIIKVYVDCRNKNDALIKSINDFSSTPK